MFLKILLNLLSSNYEVLTSLAKSLNNNVFIDIVYISKNVWKGLRMSKLWRIFIFRQTILVMYKNTFPTGPWDPWKFVNLKKVKALERFQNKHT